MPDVLDVFLTYPPKKISLLLCTNIFIALRFLGSLFLFPLYKVVNEDNVGGVVVKSICVTL